MKTLFTLIGVNCLLAAYSLIRSLCANGISLALPWASGIIQSLFYHYDTSNLQTWQYDPLDHILLVHYFALCHCTDNDPITRPRAFCDPDQGVAWVFKSQRPWQSKKNFKQLSHKSITEYISKGSVAAPSDLKSAGRTSRWNNLVRCAHRLPQGKKAWMNTCHHGFCILKTFLCCTSHFFTC